MNLIVHGVGGLTIGAILGYLCFRIDCYFKNKKMRNEVSEQLKEKNKEFKDGNK